MKKISLVALAVATSFSSGFVAAEAKGIDVLTNGWEVHGYMSSNYRLVDGNTFSGNFSKGDYHIAGGSSTGESTNQVEFVLKKNTTYQNGVFANYNLRAEYGNGNTYAYSSSGNQKNNDEAQFEIKEAFIELGALPYLGADSVIWAGHRFLNRSAGLLSGEFWKQSSGLGAGFETKLAGRKFGVAYVSADPKATINDITSERKTRKSFDIYYHGMDIGIGNLDFDTKIMSQKRTSKSPVDEAELGYGVSLTLNTNYYGLDGWAQTGIAYGKGMASNRGVNFGEWNDTFLKNDNTVFLTSYGVWNVNDKLQLGTEITHWELHEVGAWGLNEGGSRTIVAARPSYKINDNFRFELTASYAIEGAGQWHQEDGHWAFVEVAPIFTVNADFFGRPQIKPYIAYMTALEEGVGNKGLDGEKDETVFGVHAEIWF